MPSFRMTEGYQGLLSTFLNQIPETGQVMSMTADSPIIKPPYKAADIDANKAIKSNPAFEKYTGYSQQALLKKWADPANRTTTCNEFCSKCANAMGYVAADRNDGVGRFDIADYLTRYGKGHCWVPARSGAQPEYGDIFRLFAPSPDHNGVPLNHMGVSLGIEGKSWYTVESGQAGPSTGYDAIERKTRDWKPDSLQGWVNMSALLGAGDRLPYWLGGWWQVEEGPYEVWYYYFASPNKVYYTPNAPRSLTAPPIQPGTVGNVTIKGMFGLQIRWNSADVDETFAVSLQDTKLRKFAMTGKTVNQVPLTATRMMIEGLL